MNHFKLIAASHMHTHAFNAEMLDDVLKNSYGRSEMSNEDIKMAILTLHRIAEIHAEQIQDMLALLAEEPKKKFWKFWK